MDYPSKLIANAIQEISGLPGIGKRTALRLVLHLLRQSNETATQLGSAIIRLREEIKLCSECFNASDSEVCEICKNPHRNKSVICVVEDLRDVIAIENTMQYKGVYHVLGGLISPMDGIGPDDLKLSELRQKVLEKDIDEVILALSTTVEGDTTNFYIYKKLQNSKINISTIARGVAVGNELEYIDEVTLGRSILHRIPYESSVSKV